jgi:hypothetical protein
MGMLDHAVRSGAGLDTISKLMDLQDRYEKTQARKAFDAAIAAAKAKIPVIIKNKTVDFPNKTAGGRTSYRHEDLGEIARTIDPILGEFGLSYRFRTETTNGTIRVTCIISHRDGYSEENSLPSSPDASGNKNPLQAVGSAITYLQRYLLKASLGLAAAADDDNASQGFFGDPITQQEAENLKNLLTAKGRSEETFLRWVNIECPTVQEIKEIPAQYYGSCLEKITSLAVAPK